MYRIRKKDRVQKALKVLNMQGSKTSKLMEISHDYKQRRNFRTDMRKQIRVNKYTLTEILW
jgi:hypothetical protein